MSLVFQHYLAVRPRQITSCSVNFTFLLESWEALEEMYANEVDNERLEKQLDHIAFSDNLIHQSIPWEYFLETVDMKAMPFISSAKGETPGNGV